MSSLTNSLFNSQTRAFQRVNGSFLFGLGHMTQKGDFRKQHLDMCGPIMQRSLPDENILNVASPIFIFQVFAHRMQSGEISLSKLYVEQTLSEFAFQNILIWKLILKKQFCMPPLLAWYLPQKLSQHEV